MPDAQAPNSPQAQPESKTVRLHITPFRPDLLKVYLAPSVLPLAQNISYHTVETFPEKGFGYLELPEAEAQKIKKKLNGTILKGSKVRIEMAKPEKRKAREEAEAAKEAQGEADRPSKRAKKDKKEKKERKKKEQGVLEGVELPDDRKVKRGWTEPVTKTKKDKKEKKDKKDKSDKEAKKERKHSKYTKEPELLFKAKLTPVAATEVALKDKKKDKKEKKEKNKSKSTEVVVHEFEKNTKTPSFLKQPDVVISKKPAVDYVNGLGWVDEDGVVVEPETVKAKARRALELVDAPSEAAKAWIDGTSKTSSTPKVTKEQKKKKKATPPPSSAESESEESSVVSSSSEDEDSSDSDSDSEESAEESEAEESEAASPAPSAVKSKKAPEKSQPAPPAEKEVHPLEALFKRTKPTDNSITTPTKKLNPIDTSFTFFDNNADNDATEATGQPIEDAPITPYTQRDIEWRGLRSAAPTPDTAAIGRRFSFDWRRNSQERDDDEDDSDLDIHAEHQLSLNTRTNASKLADVTEEDEGVTADGDAGEAVKPESEFKKWFWENRGDLNRAWKKRRRDALKAKRLGENRKMTRRIV